METYSFSKPNDYSTRVDVAEDLNRQPQFVNRNYRTMLIETVSTVLDINFIKHLTAIHQQ